MLMTRMVLAAAFLGASALGAELPRGKAFTNSVGMKLARIEPGSFLMGCGEKPPASAKEWAGRDWDESPAHKVKITRAFFMGACEVTNAQFEKFDPAHKKLRGRGGDSHPVTHVTWQRAADFCKWLSKKEGRPYRLPTEAEWEYACRAGTETIYNTGDALSHEQANIGLGKDGKKKIRTLPVGGYKPNAWGLFDMHGNVEEWCLDWYGPYATGEQTDPVGRADGRARVTRGGSYSIASWKKNNAHYCRSSNRSGYLPEDANRCCGFRVVLGEGPKTKPLPVAKPALFRRGVKQAPAPKAGPRGKFFTDYRGKRPAIPANTWGPIFSAWNHDTALCVCPNGDVLATWYTTKSESGRELAIAASRLPAGSGEWQPASLFLDVPDVNDHAPALLSDGKRIYHFSNQALKGWVDAAVVMTTSDDSGATWSKPRIIIPRGKNPINPASMNMPVCAFIAKAGVLCVILDARRKSSCMAISKDRGKTWQLTKGLISGIHAAAAGLKDGSIVAFGRGPKPMPVSVSKDLGETWEVKKTPFGPIGVGAKAAALRLAGGALLLCSFDTGKPPITGKRTTFAALSYDGGKSWKHIRQLPGVGGYLSVAQAPNGVIHVFGSRMSCASFNEAWLKEGKPVKASPEKK